MKCAKVSPVPLARAVLMFSNDKDGKMPPPEMPVTKNGKIIDSPSSKPTGKSDSAKDRVAVDREEGDKQRDKEAKEKGDDGTAIIETKVTAGSVEKKEGALVGAEKQKE